MLAAVAWWFAEQGDEVAVGATVLTVVGSYMVSYTRARRGSGSSARSGLPPEPPGSHPVGGPGVRGQELIPGFDLLEPAIYAMAALTIFTTFQQVFHVRSSWPPRMWRTSAGSCKEVPTLAPREVVFMKLEGFL